MNVQNDLRNVAPKFGLAVATALNHCWRMGLDPIVYEANRDDATQLRYFERGVSRAKRAKASWHGYGLAVDVISKSKGWSDESFFERIAPIFKSYGLDWGGDWKTFRDLPHFQWGTLRASPSPTARRLYEAGGAEAVWKEVGAL